MTLMYKIFSSENEGSGATVIFSNGTIQQISQDNANFGQVVQILTTTPVDAINEEELLNLLIPALSVGKSLNRLSERVSFDGANILFDGDVVNDAIAEHILRIVKEGGGVDSYKALVNFMEKLYTNPSESARNSLYEFIVRHNITIDPDGDFYAYKGVKADAGSIMEGFGIVDGVSMNGSLPNKPGSILEMPRAMVDADTARGCAIGLHAGTHKYAESWARGLLLLVKINPRDVVSVPDCSYFQKIRTCRYKVVSQTVQQMTATTFSAKVGTDLHSINTLTKMVEKGVEVPVTFTYTRGNGEKIIVELIVSEIRKNKKQESIVVGKDSDGETRSYRATYISELVIDEDTLVKHAGISTAKAASAPVKTAPVTATGDIDALRAGIAKGDTVLCDFNYTTLKGEPRTVQNFEATELRATGWSGRELIVGQREDGEIRTYRLNRVTDLVVKADKTPVSVDVASVQAPAVDVATELKNRLLKGEEVVLDFTYTKKNGEVREVKNFKGDGSYRKHLELMGGIREDGKFRTYKVFRMSNIKIHDEAVAPSKPSTIQEVVDAIVKGSTVTLDFTYTTVAGEARTLKNFKADGVQTYSNLLIGERSEDGETRHYRIDRIENVVVHDIS